MDEFDGTCFPLAARINTSSSSGVAGMTHAFGVSRPQDNGRVKNAGRRDCGLACLGRINQLDAVKRDLQKVALPRSIIL